MRKRAFWLNKINESWKEKSLVWLQGVRRAGKTTLCKSILDIEIFDCEKNSHRRLLADPEDFFKNINSSYIAIDEIHRLADPSEILKIGADYYPQIKIIATGSSTLQAKQKFKDTLTDRKRSVWLTPMNIEDLKVFKDIKIKDRLLRGGLPPFLLAKEFSELAYQDWIDSFWAKDIQEQFRIENRYSFLKFFELLALQSGGLFEAQSFSKPCNVSRPTISNYLLTLEASNIAIILRPYHSNQAKEIVSAPKVYFFDTGFVCYLKGWHELHDNEKGMLWEHLILNELLSIVPRDQIHYWRDKTKNEVDFIIKPRGKSPIAIECKWQEDNFQSQSLKNFRKIHPGKINLLLAYDIERIHTRTYEEHEVLFLNLQHLRKFLKSEI